MLLMHSQGEEPLKQMMYKYSRELFPLGNAKGGNVCGTRVGSRALVTEAEQVGLTLSSYLPPLQKEPGEYLG